jgi:hypothetical protein
MVAQLQQAQQQLVVGKQIHAKPDRLSLAELLSNLPMPKPKRVRGRTVPARAVNSLVITSLVLVACQAINKTQSPPAEATQPRVTEVVELASPTPEPTAEILGEPTEVVESVIPADNPPLFVQAEQGGEFPEGVKQQAEKDKYLALLALAREKGIRVQGATDADVYQQLDEFAQANNLEVKQVWNQQFGDQYRMASAIIETQADGSAKVYWYSTEGGAFSGWPNLPSTEDSQLYGIETSKDFYPVFMWGEDGNPYMYLVARSSNKAVVWFRQAQAYVDLADQSLKNAWGWVDGDGVPQKDGLVEFKQDGSIVTVDDKGKAWQELDLASGEWRMVMPAVLTSKQVEAMSDEELTAYAPEAEEGLVKAEIFYDHMVYRDSEGIMRQVYNFETGEMFDGMSVYKALGMEFKVYLRNDPSLAEAGINPYYVINGQENRVARAMVEILAVNWAVEMGKLDRTYTQPASLAQKFQILDRVTNEFLQALADGTAWEGRAGEKIALKGAQVNEENIFNGIVIEIGENKNRPLNPTGYGLEVAWINVNIDENGRLFIKIDPSKKRWNHPFIRTIGGEVGGALRGLVNREVRVLWGAPGDIAGNIVLKLCGKTTVDFDAPENNENKSVPFQYHQTPLDYVEQCAVGNQ